MLEETLKETHEKKCMIEIFGLGYVGLPLAIRLSCSSFSVVGIDINQERIKNLSQNNLNESEWEIKADFEIANNSGKLNLSSVPQKFDMPTIGIISVPTPIPTKNITSNIHVLSAIESFLTIAKKVISLYLKAV